MAGRNGYAALVEQRAAGETKRRKLDDYETPPQETRLLARYCRGMGAKVWEPAAGSGRMAREIKRFPFVKGVKTGDIKRGQDFLKCNDPFPGSVITNPPYRDGLAERFARHAMKLADGRVCMLMQNGFLWGGKRGSGLFQEFKPDLVIVIPWRVYFIDAGTGEPIPSQFFNHAWVCWPSRHLRAGNSSTTTVWAEPESPLEFES
jgi:hypothetical protein